MPGRITIKIPRRGLIHKTSTVSVSANGFQGDVCLAKTSELLTNLGASENFQPTEEMLNAPEKIQLRDGE